jgi:cytochrome P450
MLRQPWLLLLPRRFPTPFNHRQYRALRSLNETVYGIIRKRRDQPGCHDDLLTMLQSACDEQSGRGMSDEQLRDEVMTIFVAGHETTANAMSWLTYLVGRQPEVEEKLHAELETQWPEEGLSSANVARFVYTRQVIEESLRVYPSIWSIGRQCNEPDEIGGFQIPSGMNMVVPIFHFHWSERFWPDPQRFDPERFAPERRPAPDSMLYFPFGAGPRSCIGNHFALQELLIMTAMFYRHLRFRLEPGCAVEADPLITLRPKQSIRLQIERRTRQRSPHEISTAAD